MLKLLTPRVWADITAAANTAIKPSMAAVAYFGGAGDKLLPLRPGSSLVVDASIRTVSSGGTSPEALRRLLGKGVHVYSAKDLHAKIFAFDKVAFVGSSNVSINSERTLIEAVVRFNTISTISSIRTAVSDLCFSELSDGDLAYLSKYYKVSQTKPEPKSQLLFRTLLMQLTQEQGPGRETQVQPPIGAWEHYFLLDPSGTTLPQLRLTDEKAPSIGEVTRGVVKHHHNYTIEISGAGSARPAILTMRKLGKNRYKYNVLSPTDKEYAAAYKLLKSVPNPHWSSGRRWLVI